MALDLSNASTLTENGSDKENIPPSEPPAQSETQENPIYIYEDEPQRPDANGNEQPREETLLDVLAAAAHTQEVTTVSMVASHRILRDGNMLFTNALNRQNQDNDRLEDMIRRLWMEVHSSSEEHRRVVERMREQRRRTRRQRLFRNNRTRY
jgi:hypothetical protein